MEDKLRHFKIFKMRINKFFQKKVGYCKRFRNIFDEIWLMVMNGNIDKVLEGNY